MAQSHAIVIGGSIAGMCAARALSDHFDAVTVIDQDELRDAKPRRGTPQSWHNHLLLDRGRDALEAMFPGFTDYCLNQGALLIDPAYEAAQYFPGGWYPRSRSDARILFASRPKIESCIRDMVRKESRISFIEQTRVASLTTSSGAEGIRATGVTYVSHDGGRSQALTADFVVDATGRGSKCVAWMKELGLEVEERTLDARVTYSSRWYRLPAGHDEWWKWLTVFPAIDPESPEEHRYICTVFPIEDNCFIAIMGSWGLAMPKTNADFETAYRKTRSPEFAEVLAYSQPLTDVNRTKSTRNVRRSFDKLTDPPARYIAVGDAVCAFNPIYGQGMTCAAANAVILREALSDHDAGGTALVREFYARQADLLERPWQLALTRDGAFSHASGTDALPDGLKKRLVSKYTWTGFQFLNEAALRDKKIKDHYERVFNLHETLGDFLRNPRVVYGLARYGLRKALGRPLLQPGIPTGTTVVAD